VARCPFITRYISRHPQYGHHRLRRHPPTSRR
jgi:hypothetical protein